MSHQDGGQAFPSGAPLLKYDASTDDVEVLSDGMSLRDWFAGQAIAVVDHENTFRGMAEDAYRMADAMLAAREEEEETDG